MSDPRSSQKPWPKPVSEIIAPSLSLAGSPTDSLSNKTLEYQIPPTTQPRKAPAWVWAIIAVYMLLVMAILSLPAIAAYADPSHADSSIAIAVVALVFVLCGLALLVTPVRIGRDRPMSRRSFLLPLIASSLLFAMLVGGAGFALLELIAGMGMSDQIVWAVGVGIAGVWLVWLLVFWFATRSRDPLSIAARFHRWLLLGSVAELLVAVPAHLVVRRRTECCAGIYTASAICLGTMVMFVSFGPSVMLLYWRRARQIRRG